jgi:hypothetical protein
MTDEQVQSWLEAFREKHESETKEEFQEWLNK